MKKFIFDLQRFASSIRELETSLDLLNTAGDFSKFVNTIYSTEKNLIQDAYTKNKSDEFFDTVSALINIFNIFGTKIPTGGLAAQMASFIATENRSLETAKDEAFKNHKSGEAIKQEYLNAIIPKIIDIGGAVIKTACAFNPVTGILVSTPYLGLADTTTALLKAAYETSIDPSQDLYDAFMDEWYGEIDDLVVVIGEAITSGFSSALTTLSYNGAAFIMGYSDGTTNMRAVSKNITNSENRVNITGDKEDNYIRNYGSYLRINAAGGNDTVINEGNSVVINGSAGNDEIYSSGSNVTIGGDVGDDYISGGLYVDGGFGNDIISGGKIVHGGAGNDTVSGVSNGTISGDAGNDFINSDNRNNLILYSNGDGNDSIDNFGMTDTLSIAGGGYVTTSSNGEIIIQFETDTLLIKTRPKILNVFFSEGSDTKAALYVTGTDDSNVVNNSLDGSQIKLLGGNDSINNYGDNSLLDGGSGNDSIINRGVQVTIDAGDGDNRITNYMVSRLNNETNLYETLDSNTTVNTGAGKDSIYNRGRYVTILSGAEKDSIENQGSYVTINSDTGNDLINNSGWYASINSSDDNDSIVNNGQDVTIDGGAGNDSIDNNGQNVTIDSGDGNDYIRNYASDYCYNVSINGGDGNDTIVNAHNYTDYWSTSIILDGGNGDDSIYSSGWNTTMSGGEGNDTIVYEREENTSGFLSVNGGTGDDLISVRGGWASWTKGGKGNDTVYADNSVTQVYFEYDAGDGNDVIFTKSSSVYMTISGETYKRIINDNDVILTVGEDSITLKNGKNKNIYIEGEPSGTVSLFGTAGDDYFNGVVSSIQSTQHFENFTYNYGNAIGYIETFDGNDYISQKAESTTILSGAGNDTIYNNPYYDYTHHSIDGGTGDDKIYNKSGLHSTVTISGGAGNDSIDDCGSNVTIYGNTGDDKISGGSYVDGGAGNDLIDGGRIMYGGTGDDTIINNYKASINGGDGKNLIKLTGVPQFDTATINVSCGNDTISINSAVDRFSVEEFGEDDVIILPAPVTSLSGSENSLLAVTSDSTVTIEGLSFSKWKLQDGIAAYNPEGTTGIYLSDDSLSIHYSASKVPVLLELEGIIDTTTFSVGGALVTLNAAGFGSTVSVKSNAGDYDFILEGTPATSAYFIASSDADSIENYAQNIVADGGDGADTIDSGGSNNTVCGSTGNDSIYNWAEYISIDGGADNDTITNYYADNVTLDGGEGNDQIINLWSDNIKTDGGAGNDSIENYGENVLMFGGDDNDSLENYASNVTVDGGAGDDYIFNSPDRHFSSARSDYVSISGGEGSDTISSKYGGKYVTINGGTGNDLIYISGSVLLKYTTGDGNDYITGFDDTDTLSISGAEYSSNKSGNDVILIVGTDKITLKGAASLSSVNIIGTLIDGVDTQETAIKINNKVNNTLITGTYLDDTISNSGSHVTINALAGNDYISNSYAATVSINSGSGNDSIENRGDTVSINGGEGDDSIRNFSDSVSIDLGAGNDYIYSNGDKISINGGSGNDSIENRGDTVSINGGDGDNSIRNFGDSVSIDLGAGNDYMRNSDGTNGLISGGAGNDSIVSSGEKMTVDGGAGDDSIENYSYMTGTYNSDTGQYDYYETIHSDNVSISGGTGDDSIFNSGDSVTITGGTGNDSIRNGGGNNILFKYALGDGNDLISGFKINSTLSIDGGTGTYSTAKSGSDVIVTVGDGKITLQGAASLSNLNILGKKISTSAWSLNGTTATYGDSITVTGIKSLEGISLNNKVVTISAKSLNDKTVTVSNGYTLALGPDVAKPSTSAATWTNKNGTYTYTAKKTSAGYSLSGNKISYTPASGGDKFTITGLKSSANPTKSNTGIKVDSKGVVTISTSALNGKAVTLVNDTKDGVNKITYKLAVDSSVRTKATTTKAAWTKKNSTFTYTAPITSDFYTLKGNTLNYTAKKGGEQFTLTGLKNTNAVTVSGKKVTIGNASLDGKAVTLTGDYTLALAKDVTTSTKKTTGAFTTVSKGTATYKTTSFSGYYKVSGKKISYTAGTGGQSITIKNLNTATKLSALKSGVTVSEQSNGTYKITFKNSAVLTTKAPTVSAEKGLKYTVAVADSLKPVTKSAWIVSGTTTTFCTTTTAGYTVNSKNAVVYTAKKTGSPLVELTGLAKNVKASALTAPKSKVVTLNANVLGAKTSVKSNGGNYTINLSGNMSGKKFTGTGKVDTLTVAANNANVDLGAGNDVVTVSGLKVTLNGGAGNDTLSGGKDVDWIYGGTGNDSILGNTGNDKLYGDAGNDSLRGGAGADTLSGGKGDDKLWGESGKDTFLYSNGDGKDIIYGFETGDLLQITGTFSASYNKSKKEIAFKVGTTANAITLKDFTATSFHINGDTYGISGTKLVKK